MRLIDGDALKERVDNLDGKLYSPILFEEMVKNTPTIEAEPVKHGRWIIHREKIFEPNRSECYMSRPLPTECSVCGFAEMRASGFAFCPNRGAKMDGDSND